jgi:cytochrome P450
MNGAAAIMSTLVLSADAARRIADLPTPRGGLPIVGHLHRMMPPRTHLQLEAWAREVGAPYRIRMGPNEVVVFDDPEVAQAALRDRPGGLRRLSSIRPVFRELGIDGLFSTEREEWEPQRRLIMQALNASHFRGFYPSLRAITERLLARWQQAAARGEVLQMNQELMRYTVDVTSTLAFGEDPNTIDQPGNVVQDHLALIFPMLMQRTIAPWRTWRLVKLPADRRLDRAVKAVHAYAHERIARARERMRSDPGGAPRNALEAMLAQADEPGSGFDDALIVANVLTLLLAGEDTTAYSLSWTLLFLAADPALQERMHQQAQAVLGEHGVCPEHELLKRLDAFEALAMEALRLKPVVSFLGLETCEDKVIGGVALPTRTRLLLLFRPGQTDERQFACPHAYDAGRWAHGARGEGAAHNPRAFLQFGAGPRVCPGRHLAAVEMRLVLSMLLKHFRIELACDPAEVQEHIQFTTLPSRMPVRLLPR